MKEFRADLHCHSTYSDGTESPEDLVRKAIEIGLSGFSITDHDSIDAYPRALPIAKELGLEMISGVEFSSSLHGESVHILAYSFALDNIIIQEFCQKHKKRRENRNRQILQNLAEQNIVLSEDEMVSSMPSNHHEQRTIGRPHIAQAMVQKGYVESISEAFKKYLGEGKCCYASGESFTTEETLDVIHRAKGLAVIAHPHLVLKQDVLNQLLKMNFDGLECYYGRFLPDYHKRWLKIAEKKGLFITGGSDFHGSIKPEIHLGCSWIDEEKFRILQNHFKANSLQKDDGQF